MKTISKLVACLILGVALAGCAGGTTPSTSDISDRAKQIQQYAKTLCSFVPTLATVAAILSSGASAPAATIATDICNAVTTAPLADGGGRHAYYNGIRLRGTLKGKAI